MARFGSFGLPSLPAAHASDARLIATLILAVAIAAYSFYRLTGGRGLVRAARRWWRKRRKGR